MVDDSFKSKLKEKLEEGEISQEEYDYYLSNPSYPPSDHLH